MNELNASANDIKETEVSRMERVEQNLENSVAQQKDALKYTPECTPGKSTAQFSDSDAELFISAV